MDKRKKREVMGGNLKETLVEEMPSIVEEIPVVGSAVSKIVKIAQTTAQKTKEDLEKAEEERPPKYMTSVDFHCKKGYEFSGEIRDDIVSIFEQTFESSEEKYLASIEKFICEYMGEQVYTECKDDFALGKDFVWLHFFEGCRFFYDTEAKECFNAVIEALNGLLRMEVFDRFEVLGFNDD